MQRFFRATNVVLILLCAMYFVTYIMRQNITVAGSAIQQEFGFSNTQLGFVFSAYAYAYLLFQIIGGWLGDRFGARKTLFVCGLIWAGATMMTSLATGLVSLFLIRVLMGFGVGATLPTATRAMQYWVESRKRGFAQGITHSFSRLGNALTPFLIVGLMAVVTWRGSFVVVGLAGFVWVAVWYWYFRDNPKDHPSITQAELDVLPQAPKGARPAVPWGPLIARMWPVTLTYFCYGWCLWLYLSFLAPSPRLRVMEPHLKSYPITLPQLKQVADENQIPFELDYRGNGVVWASVPLDGSRTGQRLKLEFFQTGELRAAYVEKESGELDHWLYHVRK
jgi:MFS family permease